jgi:glycine betaine/choline ABC-type transport system substrate-binding protein
VSADEAEAIEGVADGRCFAGLATATSGEAQLSGLVRVADELGVFPAFVVAPVVREERLEELPDITEALAAVTPWVDTAALARLNAEAESGTDPEELARRFLADTVPSE